MASLLIGLLLIVVAFVLMRRNGALLIDEAAPANIRERLRAGVAAEPWVAEVAELTAVYIGPRQLLVLAHVVPVAGADLLGVSVGCAAGCCRCRRSPRWRSRRSSGGSIGSHPSKLGGAIGRGAPLGVERRRSWFGCLSRQLSWSTG